MVALSLCQVADLPMSSIRGRSVRLLRGLGRRTFRRPAVRALPDLVVQRRRGLWNALRAA